MSFAAVTSGDLEAISRIVQTDRVIKLFSDWGLKWGGAETWRVDGGFKVVGSLGVIMEDSWALLDTPFREYSRNS